VNHMEPTSKEADIAGVTNSRRCGECAHCNGILKGDIIAHPSKGFPIKLNGHFTCNSTGVIYMIKCPCGLTYVGQTSRSIKTRLKEHKSSIRNYTPDIEKQESKKENISEMSVAKHFFHNKHTVAQLRWNILEQVTTERGGNIRKRLLQREAVWIKRLDSLTPMGLNESFNMRCFLYVTIFY
ncbi:hypothetical protein XELAEV_18029407mg, partial [Xenopus laevis]